MASMSLRPGHVTAALRQQWRVMHAPRPGNPCGLSFFEPEQLRCSIDAVRPGLPEPCGRPRAQMTMGYRPGSRSRATAVTRQGQPEFLFSLFSASQR